MNKELILEMFKIGCIKFSPEKPFAYTSGLKGPIYCDNRLIASHPKIRMMVANGLSDLIEKNNLNYDLLVGVATAGITHSSFLAHIRNEPLAYTRSRPKEHGAKKIVEGDVKGGEQLLLIEDLVNQGSSLKKVILLLREQGFKVDCALSIVNYNSSKASESFESLKVELFSLINFSDLADMALSQNLIDNKGYELLVKWRKNPVDW